MFKNQLLTKVMMITVIMILLFIGAHRVSLLVYERQGTKTQVEQDISKTWGQVQRISGLRIKVPLKSTYIDNQVEKERVSFAYFSPDQFNAQVNITPRFKKRSLFEIKLYESELQFDFEFEDFKEGVHLQENETLFWDQARLVFYVEDKVGLSNYPQILFDGKNLPLDRGQNDSRNEFISEIVDLTEIEEFESEISLSIRGTDMFMLEPSGQASKAAISGQWHSPSLIGQFASSSTEVTSEEFKATWEIIGFNKSIPHHVKYKSEFPHGDWYGVQLLDPTDGYALNHRASKYALLFIAGIILVVFFVEILQKLKIHPMNYLIFGAAIVVFFLLLLSLSEVVGFTRAYFGAALACTTIMSWYMYFVTHNRKFISVLVGSLVVLFGFIFIILKLEDYALLAGSIGIFIALTLVMFLTRSIDWYGTVNPVEEDTSSINNID